MKRWRAVWLGAILWAAGAARAGDTFPVPPGAGMVNVREFGAVPDDGADDTEAIRKAVAHVCAKSSRYGTPLMLYFPKGVYDLSNGIEFRAKPGSWGDGWLSGGHFIGEDRAKTVLRLKDNCPGFADPDQPRAVLKTGSEEQEGLKGKPNPEGWGNEAFRHYVRCLTVDTGKGNPGAIGVDFNVSNRGAIKDVTIRSGDGAGRAGVAMWRAWPGPGLLKNVTVEGFDVGIDMGGRSVKPDGTPGEEYGRHYQYGMTFERITLRSQRVIGMQTVNNLMALRGLVSENAVPSVWTHGGSSLLVLLDSRIARTPGGSGAAVRVAGGALARNLTCEGSDLVIERIGWGDAPPVRGLKGRTVLTEWTNAARAAQFPDAAMGTLNLPVEETPEYTNPDFRQWANVTDYGATPNDSKDDDAPAIQRAIDSGRPVVYLPNGAYHIGQTVLLRGKVRKVIGFQSSLGKKGDLEVGVRFERTGPDATILEHLWMSGLTVEHASTGALSLQHCDHGGYRTVAGQAGKTFIEDVIGSNYQINAGHRFWGRQVNSEFRPNPLFRNDGATVWLLGYKTEGAVTVLHATGGATELLGGLVYPLRDVRGPETPTFRVENSLASLTYVLNGQAYDHHVAETRGSETRLSPNYKRHQVLYVAGGKKSEVSSQ
jgi:hypothetical protein